MPRAPLHLAPLADPRGHRASAVRGGDAGALRSGPAAPGGSSGEGAFKAPVGLETVKRESKQGRNRVETGSRHGFKWL